jgi:hypothetical protein
MPAEHSLVVLRDDIPEENLHAGDVGTIVHCYEGNTAFEVEFVDGDGATLALLTLPPELLRPVARGEVLHTRIVSA